MDNKTIFANNLKKLMDFNNKSRQDVCKDLDISYWTFSDWVTGKKYPRMDSVELLANYFGVTKSVLVEESMSPEKEKDNDIMADVIVRMRIDADFLSLIKRLMVDPAFYATVDSLGDLEPEKVKSVQDMLKAFGK